ncbi:hypothetical protein [Streptomyces sp. NBC_00893]|uniref:hypothetical protein n=1 Tax=Streptomyces sp. NBC_00893 TaxID=2975862 RepID=UPI002254EE76|nr:hypothetical protein [Streptomyces sp. NBC_00893]MCX4852081.1 hypothetical protein [Streptomyces sp. NBC_00893]
MLRNRMPLFVGVLGAVAACVGAVTLTAAYAAPQSPLTSVQGKSGDAMPSVVEDFQYPGAAEIFAERGIMLKKGDGHIVFTDCSSSSDIMVDSRLSNGGFCFKVTSKSGYLTMELPDAYGIWTEGHPVRATLTAEGKKTTVDVPKNDFAPVGEGDGNTGTKRSVLVELRVTG